MHRNATLVATLACGLTLTAHCTTTTGPGPAPRRAEPRAPADRVTIRRVMPKPGTRRTKTETMTMEFSLSAGGKKLSYANRTEQRFQEEVLAVRGSTITKMKVTVAQYRNITREGDKELTATPGVKGKTYVLEVSGGKVVITENGQPVTGAAAKTLRQEYSTFGKPNRMLEALPEGPLRFGQPVPTLARALVQEFNEDRDDNDQGRTRMSNVRITLKGTETRGGQRLAVFDLKFTMTLYRGGQEFMRMSIAGPLKLQVETGWPVLIQGRGSVDIGQGRGSGTMQATETITYP